MGTESHGSGFIVEFEGLQSAKLLALDCKKAGKKEAREKQKTIRELQTDYALVTSHDTIPGLSLSDLKHWKISCQGIKNSKEQTLCDLVCGVISCCGSESLFAGHTVDAKILHTHYDTSCDIQLNITTLFLNERFAKLHILPEVQKSGVSPPTVSIKQCLDQFLREYTRKYEHIIWYSGGKNIRTSIHIFPFTTLMRTDVLKPHLSP